MKIAVAYENGEVFQHFGKAKEFRVYTEEEGRVVSAETKATDGVGHEAIADLLKEWGVNVLICGGMGAGAEAALRTAGIDVYSGAEGDVDDVIDAYLAGELDNAGVNCNHEEDGCAGDCGTCGGSCGSCGGCGGAPEIILEGPNAGKTVKVHYVGTFNDGTKFDSSYDRDEPLEFICGAGMMIPGFDKAVVNMAVGEALDIHLMPEDAYGMPDPRAILKAEIAKVPGSEDLNVGEKIYLRNMYGQPFPAVVIEKTETEITFDANHEMAGKELNFHIELLEAVDAQ